MTPKVRPYGITSFARKNAHPVGGYKSIGIIVLYCYCEGMKDKLNNLTLETEITKSIEYSWADCYAYVVRRKDNWKMICSWRTKEECELELDKIVSSLTK